MITIAADNTITIELLPADAGKQIQSMAKDLERVAGFVQDAGDAFLEWSATLEEIGAQAQALGEGMQGIALATEEGLLLFQEWSVLLEEMGTQVQVIGEAVGLFLETWTQQGQEILLTVGEIALALEDIYMGALESIEAIRVQLEEMGLAVEELALAFSAVWNPELDTLLQISEELAAQLLTMEEMTRAFGAVWESVDLALLEEVNGQLTQMLETVDAIGQAVVFAFESVDLELVGQLDLAIGEIGLKLEGINESLVLTAQQLLAVWELVDGITESIREMTFASEEWVLALDLEGVINGFAMLLEAIDLTVVSLGESMDEIVTIIDEGVGAIEVRVGEGVDHISTAVDQGATGILTTITEKLASIGTGITTFVANMVTKVGEGATSIEGRIQECSTSIAASVLMGMILSGAAVLTFTELVRKEFEKLKKDTLDPFVTMIKETIPQALGDLSKAYQDFNIDQEKMGNITDQNNDRFAEADNIIGIITDTLGLLAAVFSILAIAVPPLVGPFGIIAGILAGLAALVGGGYNAYKYFSNKSSKNQAAGAYAGFDMNFGAVAIPKLATGAVIPPNSEFLAILGDQRSGRNLETPEGLMRDIFRQELANLSLPAPTVTLNAQGGMSELVRLLFPHLEQERSRIGQSLVAGAL